MRAGEIEVTLTAQSPGEPCLLCYLSRLPSRGIGGGEQYIPFQVKQEKTDDILTAVDDRGEPLLDFGSREFVGLLGKVAGIAGDGKNIVGIVVEVRVDLSDDFPC